MISIIIWFCGFVVGVLFHAPAKAAFKWVYDKVSSKLSKG